MRPEDERLPVMKRLTILKQLAHVYHLDGEYAKRDKVCRQHDQIITSGQVVRTSSGRYAPAQS